jgi:hypothetical protein
MVFTIPFARLVLVALTRDGGHSAARKSARPREVGAEDRAASPGSK